MHKSPLRYPGGKTRACKILHEQLQERITLSNYKTLVSPFIGGGSFELFMCDVYGMDVIANDKFAPLISFWRALQRDRETLTFIINDMRPVSKEAFIDCRSCIIDETDEDMQAALYFIINRCSFSGATLSGGFSQEASCKRLTDNSVNVLQSIDLSKFTFTCEDCISVINAHADDSETFMFLDPPYYLESGKNKLYGHNGDLHEAFDHVSLRDALAQVTCPWMLTYNDCEHIRELYEGYNIIPARWSYGMNASKKSSEIIIFSTG